MRYRKYSDILYFEHTYAMAKQRICRENDLYWTLASVKITNVSIATFPALGCRAAIFIKNVHLVHIQSEKAIMAQLYKRTQFRKHKNMMGKCKLLNVLAQLSCIIPEHIAHTLQMCTTCKYEAKRCEMMQAGWHTINSIHFPVSVVMVMHEYVLVVYVILPEKPACCCLICVFYISREWVGGWVQRFGIVTDSAVGIKCML